MQRIAIAIITITLSGCRWCGTDFDKDLYNEEIIMTVREENRVSTNWQWMVPDRPGIWVKAHGVSNARKLGTETPVLYSKVPTFETKADAEMAKGWYLFISDLPPALKQNVVERELFIKFTDDDPYVIEKYVWIPVGLCYSMPGTCAYTGYKKTFIEPVTETAAIIYRTNPTQEPTQDTKPLEWQWMKPNRTGIWLCGGIGAMPIYSSVLSVNPNDHFLQGIVEGEGWYCFLCEMPKITIPCQ